jgi:hypothetical protein
MLVEKPWKQPCSTPALFKTIVENDRLRMLTKRSAVVSFAEHKRLKIEHVDLMRAAEKAIAGTKNKGTSI